MKVAFKSPTCDMHLMVIGFLELVIVSLSGQKTESDANIWVFVEIFADLGEKKAAGDLKG
jgi:hypothetical protein